MDGIFVFCDIPLFRYDICDCNRYSLPIYYLTYSSTACTFYGIDWLIPSMNQFSGNKVQVSVSGDKFSIADYDNIKPLGFVMKSIGITEVELKLRNEKYKAYEFSFLEIPEVRQQLYERLKTVIGEN